MLKISKINQLEKWMKILTIANKDFNMLSLQCGMKPMTQPQQIVQQNRHIFVASALKKYNKKSSQHDGDSDSDEEIEAQHKDDRDSKIVKSSVNSLRADLLLKAGLGIARNKIENIFYDSRIRVNGKKLQKKSVQLNEGDEIDVIRGFSQTNPSHLVISRVAILSATEREEGYSVQLRRFKSLLVENYSGVNAYKSSAVSDH